MRGVIMHGPGDVRVEDRPDPVIQKPTDAIIRVTAACICGSDLWPYRGAEDPQWPIPMGHEYVGVVEEIAWNRPVDQTREPCCTSRHRRVVRPVGSEG